MAQAESSILYQFEVAQYFSVIASDPGADAMAWDLLIKNASVSRVELCN